MEKNIQLGDKVSRILQVILFFSLPALSLFLCRNTDKWIMIVSLVLAFGISFFLVRYIFKNIFENINVVNLIFSFLVSDYILFYYYSYHKILPFRNNYYSFADWKLTILTILSMFALTIIVYFLWKKLFPAVKKFFKSLTKFEKIFLIIMSIVALVLTLIIYNVTHAFYFANSNYDVIYTADSSALFKGDAFFNINMEENDLRQPLFGLFSLPFALLAKVLSQVFFFVPNGYAVFLTTIQIILFAVTLVLIMRLFKLSEKSKLNFVLLYLACFSSISFSFILEQYIIGLFYLILTIYTYYFSKYEVNYSYIGATGTMLTSGAFFPFISHFKNIKTWLKNILKCFLVFLIIMVIFGQLGQIFYFPEWLEKMVSFTGTKIGFNDKLIQFISFIKNIFIAPVAAVSDNNWFFGYYVTPIYHYSKVGILLLIICFISFVMNRKNKMAIISFIWILFSFVLLCVVGWGTEENGLNLYSLYFSWAYIGLIYLFFERLLQNNLLKKIIVFVIVVCFLVINIPAFMDIINFGIKYYPL